MIADQAGNIALVDVETKEVVALREGAHEENIVEMVVEGENVISAGHDAKLKIWSSDLALERVIDAGSPIVAIAVGAGQIAVTTEDRRLRVFRLDGREVFAVSLRSGAYRLAASPDFDRIAIATTLPDVLVVDPHTSTVAAYPLDEDGTTCVAFVDSHTLLSCSASGEVFRLKLPR